MSGDTGSEVKYAQQVGRGYRPGPWTLLLRRARTEASDEPFGLTEYDAKLADAARKASGEVPQHTSGPWTYHIGLDYTEFYDANGNTIFQVSYAIDRSLANLISAAPELLEACRAQKRTNPQKPDYLRSQKREALLEAAIAKAEGG